KLHEDWPVIEKVLGQALKNLQAMRQEEGRAMSQEFLAHRDTIATHLERIRQRIPQLTELFRDRLFERVRALHAQLDLKIDRSDLIKEVSIFAERSDIAEEVVRLGSHLVQLQESVAEAERPGRLLAGEDSRLRLSVSATTRRPRPGEEEGVHYYFWQPDQFEKELAAGGFLEWAKVVDNYYGTLLREVTPHRQQGMSVLLDIDVQ